MFKIKDGTEKIATKHKQYADDLLHQLQQPLTSMKESERKMVADTTEKVENAQKEFINMRNTVPKLKKAYEAKCKEHQQAEEETDGSVVFFSLFLGFL